MVTSSAFEKLSLATTWYKDACAGALGIFSPRSCALCRLEDATTQELCPRCREELLLDAARPFRAETDAEKLPLNPVTGQPLPVISAMPYTPGAARTILAYKDHGRIGLAGFFRTLLTASLHQVPQLLPESTGPYRLVPIPTSGPSFRKRGFDPVLEILPRNNRALPENMFLDAGIFGLLRHRPQLRARSSHTTGSLQTRHRMAQKKFRVAGAYKRHNYPAPILLIDDVMTTGASLAAATRLLTEAGFDVAGAVVLASVLRH